MEQVGFEGKTIGDGVDVASVAAKKKTTWKMNEKKGTSKEQVRNK